MSLEQCFRESRLDNRRTRPNLLSLSEHITGPENATQIDLVPELTPSFGRHGFDLQMFVGLPFNEPC